ncbi:PKD domain-containing protein [Winogradskyella algicola]|uniref:PKD domain-containing protein n=1 Tax=Winogradskyella algicola TaxID=2575815 RepID=UPI0011082644|nr:PKD domain-containing protein [Winogradskyella algicola]
MKKIVSILLLGISFSVFSQDVLMQNGTVTSCSGIFYDSGGEFSNYSNNENFVLTICPEEDGQRTRLDFYDFVTQLNSDVMTIYDGPDVTSDIINSYSGPSSPGLVFASFNNTSGCLTIEFSSDNAGNGSGWQAEISCANPCQDITAVLDSTNPIVNAEGIIEVCSGDLISLSGSGIFENDGTGATYTWDLGDGNLLNGQNINFSYDQPGVYLVNLDIRDTNMDNFMDGCPNTNSINQVIRVSGAPDFTGTEADDSTLCFGGATTIEGVADPLLLFYNCPPPESVETFLPDGSGVAYSTCINVTCFADDAVLTDVSQIIDICMNIEHSYSGDLDIFIQSPNGQEIRLFDQAGGGTYFGGANDDQTLDPGTGEDYCFSMSATTLLADAPTEINGTNPPNNSWVPGTYLPYENFDALLGSPLNGEWCIRIVDNLSIDNGYIFSWELNFDPSLELQDYEYTPQIISQSWDTDSSITEINGNIITVAPESEGEHCYTFRTVDEFGCEYTEEVCVTMTAEGQPPTTFYEDLDGDGYGDPNSTIEDCSDTPPFGYVVNGLDCNDTNNTVNPDADDSEGNGVDENCDGVDGNLLSLDDFRLETIEILQNPFKDVIVLSLPEQMVGSKVDVVIYDLSGRQVYRQVHDCDEKEIKIEYLNNLVKAQYFIEISNKTIGLKEVRKIMKK